MNVLRVIVRSAEGIVITLHTLTNIHFHSLSDEVRGMCLCGQEDAAKQEITDMPSPSGHGFRAGGRRPCYL